jgi:hypothetical protein
MIPQDPGMREITQWWDEFCRSTDTRQELLETAIGNEVRRRIFEVHASDEVVCLFEKLDMVLDLLFIGKKGSIDRNVEDNALVVVAVNCTMGRLYRARERT